jgi:hypothetical protein
MNERDYLAERFEEHRTHLRAVAYRMLGSLSEVDDAVQEALRLVGEDTANVLPSAIVAVRTCTVSFIGLSGIRHSVDVTAESVYEAAALGVSARREWLC